MKIHKFKPTKKKDTLLFKLLIGVAILHAVGLLILGGMVISEIVLQPETTFEAPPPPEKVEQKKQYQHKAQQKQQSSNKLVKRIQIPQAKMNNVPTTNIALPSSDVAGSSLSGGLAPKGFGDLNITMTSVNLMGLAGKTEKIVILLDASRYMMTDAKGALNTYNVIKNDIKGLVEKLPPTILFNVIAYSLPVKGDGIAINVFNPAGLISASQANKEKLYSWIDPINNSLKNLEVKNNYKSKFGTPPQTSPDNPDKARIYRAYHAAMEQGADTIYILTSNWADPSVIKRPLTQADKEAHARKVEAARKAHAAKAANAREKVQDKNQAKKEVAQAKAASMTEEQKAAVAAKKAADAAKAKAAAAAKSKAIAEAKAKNQKAEAEARAKAKAWLAAENAKRAKAGTSLMVATVEQVMAKQGFKAKTVNVPKKGGGGGGIGVGKFKAPEPPKTKGYNTNEMIKYYITKLQASSDGKKVETPTLNMIIFKGEKENTKALEDLADEFCAAHNKGKVKTLIGSKL